MNDLSNILMLRKSIRKYSARAIEEELLNELLVEGCRASNTGNMQLYSIVVTREKRRKEELAPCHFNQKMVTEAPLVLTFCADVNRFKRWCSLRNAVPGFDNFLSFLSASIDAIIVAQTVCISAEARGLGICYLGTTTYMAHKIIEILKLPGGVVPLTTVTLGWPAEDPEPVDRLPLEAIVHNEFYRDYTDESIDRYYGEKENRCDSKQFIKENNRETLAQVFTDVRYKKTDNEYFSKLILQVLKDQGFLT